MAKYVAGWNMPGCLPEMEPEEFETFEDAKQYIIDELKLQEDQAGSIEDEDSAEDFCHEAEDVNLESEPFATSEMPDGYVYWVDRAE